MNAGMRMAMAVATALGVASCGGGGGGGEQFSGIDRLGISSGTITGFGSIFVNGVEWRTGGAAITVDDNQGTESDLRIGQVVRVRGTLDDSGTAGDADSIEFDNEVEGAITAIDLAASRFTVLGQSVLVSADTGFDDSIPAGADGQRGLADLLVGNVVEVSGYRDAGGAIRATRVELRGGAAGVDEVKGSIAGIDTVARTFTIGTLSVNYAAATVDPAGYAPANGDVVEVRGSLAGNVLNAAFIEREDGLGGDDEEIEVEGYVTDFVSAADFRVAGVSVTTNSGTEFEGGSAADLANNLKVEVEGDFDTNGRLVADKVDIRVQPDDTDVEIEGNLASRTQNTDGTLTLRVDGMNVDIVVNGATRIEDATLDGLVVGNHVEIRAAERVTTPADAANDVIATRLKLLSAGPEDEVELRGRVQGEGLSGLTILGVEVQTDDVATEFRDLADAAITAAAFYAAIAGNDDVVKVESTAGNVSGNVFFAEEAELEELR